MITPQNKNKILQIVNVFETGSIEGKYGSVVRMNDGPNRMRQITFGRSQTTEFGNLKRLIEKYISENGMFANDFSRYVSKIGKNSLADDQTFIQLLKNAGNNDPVMKKVQDDFFDLYYYLPAFNWAEGFGFTEPLSMLVIYDSFIHSGQIRKDIRQKFAEVPPSSGGNERKWIEAYVNARHNWLANHGNALLHGTVYRTKCFKNQISSGNWDLSQTVNANGVIVNLI